MKQLECETMRAPSHSDCASELLDLVPAIMRTIRSRVRTGAMGELSVPQFRSLAFISASDEPSLSDVADHIGLSLPSMSKMIDQLLSRGLVERTTHQADRRRVVLRVTREGQRLLGLAREATQSLLAQALLPLNAAQRKAVCEALRLLGPLFDRDSGGNRT